MKAQSKNRKHPTCSRCRFHGKNDVRVLQHQCPYKNCPCSSCLLIKAQKGLEKAEDVPTDHRSSSQKKAISNYNGYSGVSVPPRTSEVYGASNYGPWTAASQSAYVGHARYTEYPKIKDFQTLCVTFPDYSPAYLQSLFEECDGDFQKTVDKILMSRWCTSDSEYKAFSNNTSATGAPAPRFNSYWTSMSMESSYNASSYYNSSGSGHYDASAYGSDANNAQRIYETSSGYETGPYAQLYNYVSTEWPYANYGNTPSESWYNVTDNSSQQSQGSNTIPISSIACDSTKKGTVPSISDSSDYVESNTENPGASYTSNGSEDSSQQSSLLDDAQEIYSTNTI